MEFYDRKKLSKKIESALEELIRLIDDEQIEFQDAAFQVMRTYALSENEYAKLKEAYDAI